MPGTPQQNGVAERWNRTILDKVRALIHHAGLSAGFWEQAVDAAVHIYNRTPTRVLGWRTPYELWSNKIPDVSYFRVFGCKAYVHVPEGKRQKLDPRSTPMTFIGYETGSKGYRFWNPDTRTIVLSRDVTFDERSFPAKASSPPSVPPARPLVLDGPVMISFIPESAQQGSAPANPPAGPAPSAPAPQPVQPTLIQPGASTAPATLPPPPNNPQTPKTPANRPPESRGNTEFFTPPSAPPPGHTPTPEQPNAPEPSPTPDPPRPEPHSRRLTIRIPARGNVGLRRAPVSSLPGPLIGPSTGPPKSPSPWRLRENPRPNPRYTGSDNAADRGKGKGKRTSGQLTHVALLAAAEYQDPLTFKQAMSSDYADEWRAACQYEIDALAKNRTWDLVDLPTGRKAVKSKWVFKRKADGRFRARLVAKGFTLIQGIDF